VTGARQSVKIFGIVSLQRAKFIHGEDEVFNAVTYLRFLDHFARTCRKSRIYRAHLIQDNASYHKDEDVWRWFGENRRWLTVHQLPPYSPEFNATERLWHHTRVTGTHNRYFVSKAELQATLMAVFHSIQKNPDQIKGYLHPFL
jgi:transposase